MTWRYWEAQALCAAGGRRQVLGCLVWARDVRMANRLARQRFSDWRVVGKIRVRPYTRHWRRTPWPDA